MNLSREDLLRLRRVTAMEMTIEARPDVFSKDEIYNLFIDRMNLMEELMGRYQIDESLKFQIDIHTGLIENSV